MNPEIFKQSRALRHTRRLATLFLLLCASLPAAQAKDHKRHTSAAVEVIASMSFDKKPPADMTIQRVKGKPYLFVQLANAQGVVVVDISKPDKLKIVSSLSDPDATGASHLSINGNAAVMSAVADGLGSQASSKSELVLWDISEPGNPRVVQRFSGVVRVLRDERNYTYVLNQDGLWVVYDKQNPPAAEDKNWLLGMYG
jgi:hypothetical protein